MVYDFHTHTTLSDGELSPVELIRRAIVNGYGAVALTDHCGPGEMERMLAEIRADCLLAAQRWDFCALPGVELTHLPASAISEIAAQARRMGAAVVVVHGETSQEPVEAGTNLAAVVSPHVDILAHPGHLTEEEARLAAENGVYIEITRRGGHNTGNGQVARAAEAAGARMIVNSDTHSPGDLLTDQIALRVARGAGLPDRLAYSAVLDNPAELVRRARARLPEGFR